jgi:hypothetical protein
MLDEIGFYVFIGDINNQINEITIRLGKVPGVKYDGL